MGPGPRRPEALLIRPVILPLRTDLVGSLVRRYKRFLADVETHDGEVVTVHCANPGAMLGCSTPGASVRCSTSTNPKRKLRHTLEMIRVGRSWVGIQPLRANQLVARALEARALPTLSRYRALRAEVPVGEGSRLDFRLDGDPKDPRPAFIEVKSVTLKEQRVARFPDAITTRGRRHMETLARLREEGARSVLLFVVQRVDCDHVEPADAIDPDYGEALRNAVARGVEVIAVQVRVRAHSIELKCRLPVVL